MGFSNVLATISELSQLPNVKEVTIKGMGDILGHIWENFSWESLGKAEALPRK